MKKILLLSAISVALLSGCRSTNKIVSKGGWSLFKTEYAITSTGENLSALAKVTDNEESCITPFGGDNGKNLFFAAREKGGYWNIYKKENPFSGTMTQKTSGKNFNTNPVYSAVLDKIAFRCQNEGASNSDIFIMSDSKGRSLTQITESYNADEDNPSFSPDGKWIVYHKTSRTVSSLAGVKKYGKEKSLVVLASIELWLRNLETGESILLGDGCQPSFAPDSKSIVYVKYSSDAKSSSIWRMNIDGTNQEQITDAKKGNALFPRFSPDGQRIVFQSARKDKKDFDIYIIDVNGNNLEQVTINKSYDGQPYWSNDGYIYFVSDRGSKELNFQIWRFKID